MVQVRKNISKSEVGDIDIIAWLDTLPGFSDQQTVDRMRKAFQMASASQKAVLSKDQKPHGLIGCFDAGMEMVNILASFDMDEEVLIAALIYRAVREGRISIDQVELALGGEVASLVKGVLKMAAISNVRTETTPVLGQGNAQVDNIRKMLVAMVDDVRVGLIKLAERTQAIRAVKNHPDPVKQRRVAREVFDIYAPLAHRLGIGQIKW